MNNYKKDCFAYNENDLVFKCSALNSSNCFNCRFYRTKDDYRHNVSFIKYKDKRNVL